MRTTMDQSAAQARELAKRLKDKADGADAAIKAKLMAAAAHADAVAKNAESGRPRPMLDEAQKLSHSISDAVAQVRTHGGKGEK